jgi:hypothetical protein
MTARRPYVRRVSTTNDLRSAAPVPKRNFCKLGKSDYLFFANDKQTLWRVYRVDRHWDLLPEERVSKYWWVLERYLGHPGEWRFSDCFDGQRWERCDPPGWEIPRTRRCLIEHALSF